MNHFTDRLTAMFTEIEPQLREAQSKRYAEMAAADLSYWLKALEGPEPKHHEQRVKPVYVIEAPEPGFNPYVHHNNWERKQSRAKQGLYSADLAGAERDAQRSVDDAKAHFVKKQADKLLNATKLRADRPNLAGYLHFGGRVTGTLVAEYANGDHFSVKMSMIVNCRRTRGRYTSFYQFPARFVGIQLKGEKRTTASEAWLSENFG